MFPIWRLQCSVRRRLGLIFLFTMGGGAIAVSLLRFLALWQLSHTADVTYVYGSVTIITSVEFAVAIITANMPGVSGFLSYLKTRGRTGLGQGQGQEENLCPATGGSSGTGELETIGAQSTRTKRHDTLDSGLESGSNISSAWSGTGSEDPLGSCHSEAVVPRQMI